MPSLSAMPERHVEVDRRQGHYLCFPDIAHSGDGALLCVYNEFDRHVGTRRRLLLKRSQDGGRTWDAPRLLCATESHCPRIARLSDGLLVIADDAGPVLHFSADCGRTWAQQPGAGLGHGLIDRVLELDPETLFTTGHLHRGSQPQPKIRQAPTEQMAYLSRNRGRHWEAHSVIAGEKCLVLCEASVIRLPDAEGRAPGAPPRLLALMRENSFVGEPMYFCLSEDGGATWGAPRPTPLVGHRPTLGFTRSGRLLVTYRDVGPDPGTKAWLGTLEELCSDFAVHGLHPGSACPQLTPEGLLVRSQAGPPSPQTGIVRYGLRPLTDPESATASLEAEVLVRESDANGCGLYLGQWWKLFPDGVLPDCDADAKGEAVRLVPYRPGEFHTVRVDYEPGLCRLFVDGRPSGEYAVDRMRGETRPILAGAVARAGDNACEVLWRRMRLSTREPRLGRDYDWSWDHESGKAPDAWIAARVLELQNDRRASFADFGYSGWVELCDPAKAGNEGSGQFVCVYHHGGGGEPGYREGYSAHVAATRFSEADFG